MKNIIALLTVTAAVFAPAVSFGQGSRKSIFDEQKIKGGFFERADGLPNKEAEPVYDDFEQRRRAERQFESSASSESSQESLEKSAESWTRE